MLEHFVKVKILPKRTTQDTQVDKIVQGGLVNRVVFFWGGGKRTMLTKQLHKLRALPSIFLLLTNWNED